MKRKVDNRLVVEITALVPAPDDARGWTFSVSQPGLSALSSVDDVHLASIEPGHVRGNHFHTERTELLLVVYQDQWSFHWDSGPDTPVQSRTFDRSGAVAITVPVHCSHAVRNDGTIPLIIAGLCDGPYDPGRQVAVLPGS